MCLKTKIETTLCILKNEEYKIQSQKLRVIKHQLKQDIINTTQFLDFYDVKLVDRIRYILKNRSSINTCSHCNKPIISLNKKFCSSKCSNNSEKTKNKFRENYSSLSEEDKTLRNNKRANTFKERYGGYTLQSKELKKKMKSTMISKYGVEHSFHHEAIKQKALNTWIKKYSVDSPFKCNVIKEKIRRVIKERYGVDNALSINPENRTANIIKSKIEKGWIIPNEFLSDYQIYRKKVRRLTEHTYKLYKNSINPNNLERVTNGKNGFQLDHRYSIIEGFLNNVEPEIISHPCNLQMIEWSINRNKSKRCDIDLEQLKNKISEYKK